MATFTISVTGTSDTFAPSIGRTYSKTVTVSATPSIFNRQTIGTSDETLDLGDVSSLGWLVGLNKDVTNYVEFGHTNGTYSVKAKAGEPFAFRVGSGMSAIHAKANTGACDIEYLLLSD